MNLLVLDLRHNLINYSVPSPTVMFFDIDFLYLHSEVILTPTFYSSCGEFYAVVTAELPPVHHQTHHLPLATTLSPVDSSKFLLLWSWSLEESWTWILGIHSPEDS